MYVMRLLATAVLSVALLIPGTASAAVALPALDLQLYTGDSGAVLTDNGNGSFDFNIEATAFAIITNGTPIDITDQSFTLHGSNVAGSNTFSGTFDVAGSLLSGTFDNLSLSILGSGSIDFSTNLTYTSGSLMGDLTGGRLEGIGNTSSLAAKLGPVTVVPVPASVWLFGTGLIGLISIARRKV